MHSSNARDVTATSAHLPARPSVTVPASPPAVPPASWSSFPDGRTRSLHPTGRPNEEGMGSGGGGVGGVVPNEMGQPAAKAQPSSSQRVCQPFIPAPHWQPLIATRMATTYCRGGAGLNLPNSLPAPVRNLLLRVPETTCKTFTLHYITLHYITLHRMRGGGYRAMNKRGRHWQGTGLTEGLSSDQHMVTEGCMMT